MMRKFYGLLVVFASLVGIESASARNFVLEWNASTSPSVAGYNIYYGTTSGSYSNKLNVGSATSLAVSNLACGVTYYFAATAYDAHGDESGFSSEITYIPTGVLTMAHAAGAGNPATLRFPVEPGHWYEIQATTDLQNWNSIGQTDVATTNAWMQFTDPNAGSFASRFYRLVLH